MKFHHLLAVVLLLVGCTETKQANQPTTYPAYAPGAPVPGGLQVAFAQPNPPVLTATKMVTFVQGNLLVHFNGAATQPGQVIA